MNCNNPNATKSKGKYVATDGTEHEIRHIILFLGYFRFVGFYEYWFILSYLIA